LREELMTKEEYIKYIETRYKSKGLEERYEAFKSSVIFGNGMSLVDYLIAMDRYSIIRKAHEWTELYQFTNLVQLEIGEKNA
jgi:hypothetical protein